MRILFFAHLKSITGCAEMTLEADGLDTQQLWARLTASHPGLDRFRPSVRLARNAQFVGEDARFGAGDEVALIPPVSGG
jgi:molybdopterin synthase catalytic subunit/molybdopterin synthase sulfur carrier subunit